MVISFRFGCGSLQEPNRRVCFIIEAVQTHWNLINLIKIGQLSIVTKKSHSRSYVEDGLEWGETCGRQTS